MPRAEPPPIFPRLWRLCQEQVYPKWKASLHPPFPKEFCSPRRKPASWLYHTLAEDLDLAKRVFPCY